MIPKETVQKHKLKIVETNKKTQEDSHKTIDALKKLLPNVVNSDGQVDLKALQDAIDSKHTTSNDQGYELTFAGKGIARHEASTPTPYELKTQEKQSKHFESTENTVIRGDNIDVLKILKQNYFGKIKMIYIDPPYNTKSENFVYKDNFKHTDEDLIEKLGMDEDTQDFLHNVYGTRSHSGWLAFMYPRLKLARDLLTDDGVIFISIDDNEQANLKIICDEIFGEDNFVECFNLQVRYTNKSLNEKDNFQKVMEYCYIYSKNKSLFKPNKPYDQYDLDKFKFEIIEESKGKQVFLNGKNVTIFKNNEYKIVKHSAYKKNALKETWASGSVLDGNTSGKFFKNYLENRKSLDGIEVLYKVEGIGEDGLGYRYFTGPKKEDATKGKFYSGIPLKRLEELNQGNTKKYKPIINFYDLSADFGNINHEGGITFRGGKKPVKMIKEFVKIANIYSKDLILDFFAGSGTTGDAVMQLNAEDGGNRKFILVQWDEAIDTKKSTEAHNFCTENKLAPVISSITIERLNRAGEKLKKEWEEKESSKLLDQKPMPDIGYKVFSLTKKPQLVEREGQIFEVEKDRKGALDTMYNMLAATGQPLHLPIKCIVAEKLYQCGGAYYLLGNVDRDTLDKYRDSRVYLDGWSDIDLECFLNLDVRNKENISVIY